MVDVEDPRATALLVPELIMQVVPDTSAGVLLLADPWELHAYAADGLKWSSGRLSVEGLTVVAVDERAVLVRVEDADGELEERRIDVQTGRLL
ncbi:MAG: hypothetical protein KF782_25275 [Labilithrix sp.]|nr:hypothetical protein [Labilithrix sp.]